MQRLDPRSREDIHLRGEQPVPAAAVFRREDRQEFRASPQWELRQQRLRDEGLVRFKPVITESMLRDAQRARAIMEFLALEELGGLKSPPGNVAVSYRLHYSPMIKADRTRRSLPFVPTS
jgi:hypothetical protein